MLQASSQYLRPEYLAAPPPAVDTKSSPLALLAQTCSAIGADTANPKLLAANIEKSTKSLKTTTNTDNRDKSSPLSSHSSSVSTGSAEQQQIKSSFKPYESTTSISSNNVHERLERSGSGGSVELIGAVPANLTNNQSTHSAKSSKSNHNSATPTATTPHQQQQQNGQRCESNQSATSQRDSPAVNGLRRTPTSASAAAAALDLQQRMNGNSPHRSSSKDSSAAASVARAQAAADAAMLSKEANYMKALQAAAAASAGNGGSAYYSGYSGATAGGMPYPMDLMTASALMASPHTHPMFKNAAALNPYLNYARLKGFVDPATAAAMMQPNICRDPYCTGCPSSPHFLNKATGQPCPAGCPQCESSNNSAKASSNHSSSLASSNSAAAAAAASSYHAQLAALVAASQMPYVCSWIGGDTAYCGKRFSNSDELFQHLRTHTASVPDSVLSAAAAGGIPPNHPIFQRTYPTPPLSPLSTATRYHPYAKPSSLLPPSLGGPSAAALAGMPMPPHPALAQYFSPYSLYGPRMGSSSHP